MCDIINKIKLYFPEIIRLVKFLVVGGTGMLVSLGLLFLFTEIFGFYYMVSAILVGLINTTFNFFANHWWSFSDRNDISLKYGYAKFIMVMILYFAVYYVMLYILTEFVFKSFSFYFMKDYMLSSLCATVIATIPKYILCFVWVWKIK